MEQTETGTVLDKAELSKTNHIWGISLLNTLHLKSDCIFISCSTDSDDTKPRLLDTTLQQYVAFGFFSWQFAPSSTRWPICSFNILSLLLVLYYRTSCS